MHALEGGFSPVYLPGNYDFTYLTSLPGGKIPAPHILALHCGKSAKTISQRMSPFHNHFLLHFFKGTPKSKLEIQDNGDFCLCIYVFLSAPSRKTLIIKSHDIRPLTSRLVLCRIEYFKWCPWDSLL